MSEDYLGLNSSSFVEGGGRDDIDADITSAQTVVFNYPGTDVNVPAIEVNYQPVGQGKPWTEHYTAGSMERIRPSADGTTFVRAPGSKSRGLANNCQAAQYIRSIEEADPEFRLGPPDGVKALAGKRVHLVQVPRLSDRTKNVLVIQQFLDAPTGTRTNGRATTTPNEDLADEATEAIQSILEENEGRITKIKLNRELFKLLDGNENRQDIMGFAMTAEFLKSSDVWNFDGKTVSLP